MTKVALRGLAGRKLRAVLTGIAIVLGVAMISGTYILTDTVQRAFNEPARRLVRRDRRGRHRQGPRHLDRRRQASAAARRRVAPRRRARRRRGGARHRERSRREHHEDPRRRRARSVNSEGWPTLGFGIDTRPGARAVQPAQPLRGPVARGRRRGRHRRGNGGRAGLRGRRHGRDLDAAAEAGLRGRRGREVRRGRQPRRRSASSSSRFPRRRSCSAARASSTRSRSPRDEGLSEDDLVTAIQPVLPGDVEVVSATRGGAGAGGRGERLHLDLPLLPPRVRRDRALRRRVRHLQHLLDHRRPADARVRHAADDRRVAAAGPRLGDPRVARHRAPRVARRARPRRRARGGDRGALREPRRRPSDAQTASSRRARSSSRSPSGSGITLLAGLFPAIRATRVPPISAVREGATLPRSRFAPLRAVGRGRRRRRVAAAARARDVHRRARTRAIACCRSRAACSCSSSGSRCSRRSS